MTDDSTDDGTAIEWSEYASELDFERTGDGELRARFPPDGEFAEFLREEFDGDVIEARAVADDRSPGPGADTLIVAGDDGEILD